MPPSRGISSRASGARRTHGLDATIHRGGFHRHAAASSLFLHATARMNADQDWVLLASFEAVCSVENLVPKLLFGNARLRNSVSSPRSNAKQSFADTRSQTGVWERGVCKSGFRQSKAVQKIEVACPVDGAVLELDATHQSPSE